MAEDMIGVRIGEDRKRAILDLVEKGVYNDMSDFVTQAIDLLLNPEKAQKERTERVMYLLKNNPQIRDEIRRIVKDLQ